MRKPRSIDLELVKKNINEFDVSEDIRIRKDGTDYDHNFVATVDKTDEKAIGVFKKGYEMVDHKDVIQAVIDKAGRRIQGNVWGRSLPERLYLYIYPEDWERSVGDRNVGDVVKFGIRVTNSLDGNTSLGAHIVGFRLVCSNGMMVQDLVKGSYHKHTTEGSIELFENELENLLEFGIDEVVERYEKSKEYVSEPKVVLERLKVPDKLKSVIIEEMEDKESLFDIYNTMTNKLSHGFIEDKDGNLKDSEQYSESYLERLHRQATRILLMADEEKNVKVKAEV